VLEISGLSAGYGAVRALDGIEMTVAPASITAVLGANGAGKTTLLRVISGLVPARSGRARFDGDEITSVRVEDLVRRGISHVPEGRGVIEQLTVDENLRLGGLWRGSKAELRADHRGMLDMFPALASRLHRRADLLSGGERQMLAIARALMSRPRLLLLDEPSLGLAPRVAAEIIATLRDLRDGTGLTLLLVEQNAATALSVADHAIVLNLGRKVVDDRAHNLVGDDRVMHAYLGLR
jgi:branched-chain amino acid transport system ATP-binding protein